MKKLIIFFLSLMMLVSLTACSSGNKVEEGPRVLYSNGGPIEFFETPWLNPGSYFYNKTLYGRLLFADENMNAIPNEGDLAKSYEMSADGKTLTFTLRDGIKWHDGSAITPEDIKFSIEYALLTPVLNTVFASTFKAIQGSAEYLNKTADNISGIAIDGQKLTLTFDKVASDALLTFTQFAPLPKASFENVDPVQFQQAAYWQAPIGSGPFMVDEVKMNDYTTLKPFEDYYGGVANFSVHLTPSAGDSDPNIVVNAQAGTVDYAYTKMVKDKKSLETVNGITINPLNIRYTRLFYANKFPRKDGTPSPLADARVRQAIRYAIDMASIATNLFDGAAVPANSLTPDGGNKVSGLDSYAFNPEKAKQLLTDAKWNPDTVLKMVYYYTDQTTVDLMITVQKYLADVGVKMEFALVEGDLATILWKAPADPVNGPSAVDWDLAYAANAAMSLHEYYDRYQSGYAINSHTPEDKTLNALIAATNSSVDAKVQQDAFYELQKYENSTMFTIPLYYQPVFIVTSKNLVKGPATWGNPQFNYKWDIQNWEVAPRN